jgi:hypothetical protein
MNQVHVQVKFLEIPMVDYLLGMKYGHLYIEYFNVNHLWYWGSVKAFGPFGILLPNAGH